MLPFLKPRSQTGLTISVRKPDGSSQESHTEGQEDAGLDSCSEDLIKAVHAKDGKAVTAALKAAYAILDSRSDESEPSEDETSAS